MTPAHILLAGCGRWGRHILRDLVSLGCAVTVVDVDDDARAHALGHGARTVARRIDEVRGADGVVVATPASTHRELVEQGLGFGVPVFCEKPFVLTSDDADALATLGGDRLFVMDKWRYHEGIEALRDLASSGEAGEIVALHTTRIGWSPPQVDVDPVWTLAPHDLTIALEILGTIPAPVAASADVHDGRVVGLSASLGDRPSLTIEVSGVSPVTRREVRLTCSGLVAVLPDALSDHLLVIERPAASDSGSTREAARGEAARQETARRMSIGTEQPLLRELRAFVGHLAGGPPPKSSAKDAALVTGVLETLREMADLDAVRNCHGDPRRTA